MVLVPIRQQLKELNWKNILIKPENILTIQNYKNSMYNDSESKAVPIGIYDSIKDKIGISIINFFLDQNGKIYIQENNQGKNNLIEFSNMDDVRRIY